MAPSAETLALRQAVSAVLTQLGVAEYSGPPYMYFVVDGVKYVYETVRLGGATVGELAVFIADHLRNKLAVKQPLIWRAEPEIADLPDSTKRAYFRFVQVPDELTAKRAEAQAAIMSTWEQGAVKDLADLDALSRNAVKTESPAALVP